MNIPTVKTPMGRRLAISGLAFAVVAGIGGAIWLTSSTAPASASVSQTASSLDSALNTDDAKPSPATPAERAKLKADLKAARALTGQARVDALKKIRTDAKAGAYGGRIENRLGKKADRRAAFIALLPDSLQADLTKLKAMPAGEDRTAFRKQIRADALAGKYGDKVQKAAELLKR
ncbi:MAG: hypothetical protein JWR83_206 [Aeromicrobium sp.]|nr:hypothetical protein [Aeromicrobium sp.]